MVQLAERNSYREHQGRTTNFFIKVCNHASAWGTRAEVESDATIGRCWTCHGYYDNLQHHHDKQRQYINLAYSATKNRTQDATNNNIAGSDGSADNLVQVAKNESMSAEDGCGLLVKDRSSSTWKELSSSEVMSLMEIQTCLRRIGWHKHAVGFGEEGLSCGMRVDVQTVRSTLARYGTIWLHGDSIMEQQFYTLACMLNASVDALDPSDWPKKMQWNTGLHSGIARAEGRYNERSREMFTFRRPKGGETGVLYSRFGRQWGLNDNLYKHDFPYSIDALTENDAVLTNAAAVHYDSQHASEFEGAMQFIARQSLRTNASVFVIEPTPEEWPTSNGLYAKDAYRKRAACARLDGGRLLGRGEVPETIDRNSSRVKPPDLEFFERLYPGRPWEANAAVSECVPDCMPNTWRTDFVRSFVGTARHRIRLVPIYWQLGSWAGGRTPRGRRSRTARTRTCMRLFSSTTSG